MVRLRIAPSPSGKDLHIGNAYTALINFAFSRKNKGKFIIRIEDTDRKRFIPQSQQRILNSLKWLGLSHDEGPDLGGPYKPYRQSERLKLYRKFSQQLVENGYAYYCFCSQDRLAKMRQQQQSKGQIPRYDGRCKRIGNRRWQIGDGKYVVRLNVPEEGVTEFTDIIRGKIRFENKKIDDQVLLKSDGYPTYHLAVVIDDHLMKISHVIRGDEWISSTPKHVLLYRFLGWDLPQYAHLPLLRNPDRSKLSKRKNPVWVSWYREQGFLPEAIVNYLSLMGWSHPEEKEIFSLEEFIKVFDLKDVKSVGPIFDITKLEWMNGEYIRKYQISNIKYQILEYYKRYHGKNLSESLVEKTIPLIKPRIKKIADYWQYCRFFFKRPETYEKAMDRQWLTFVTGKLKKINSWTTEMLHQWGDTMAKELKVSQGKLFMDIRIAVTGKRIGPPLFESMELLGKKECLQRLKNAAALA